MSKIERRVTIAAVAIPFLGFLVAIPLLWGGAVSALDLGIMAVMYLITGFGITVGYHRLFTHRSFETTKGVRAGLAIAGSMSVQGAVIHWVADHRKHHDFSDEDGDPHSPHTHGLHGWRGVIVGMWHSHTGWLFDRTDRASAKRYARDLVNDPMIRKIDSMFLYWVLLGLAIPFVAGFTLSGFELMAGLTAMLWGGLVRIFLQHHATWSVNSVCHMYGDDPFETGDQSRNNWGVALVALGEGWHHNHHAFPTSARHGLRRHQIDPSYGFILLLEKLGLAWNVRSPKPAELQRKLKGSELKTSGEDVSAPAASAASAAAPVAGAETEPAPESKPAEAVREREPAGVV